MHFVSHVYSVGDFSMLRLRALCLRVRMGSLRVLRFPPTAQNMHVARGISSATYTAHLKVLQRL